jgi:hypothetical protein
MVTIGFAMPSRPDLHPDPGATTSPSPSLVAALRRVLRPMVRLMVARGITYPHLSDLLKGLFVEVAERDFRLGDKPPTDSRVSLVSGVHRKDVSRLRASPERREMPPAATVTLASQVFSRWLGDPAWRGSRTAPRPLPRLASDGGERSFESLVAGISSDIRPRVVLDDWLDRGLVTLDDRDRVCINVQAFVPARGEDDKLFYFALNLHDHAAAASHNLMGGDPHFDRSVHADGLSPASVLALKALAAERGMQTLLALNEAVQDAERRDRDRPADAPRERFTLGVYVFTAPQEGDRPGEPR